MYRHKLLTTNDLIMRALIMLVHEQGRRDNQGKGQRDGFIYVPLYVCVVLASCVCLMFAFDKKLVVDACTYGPASASYSYIRSGLK